MTENNFYKCSTLAEYIEFLSWESTVFIPEVRKKTKSQCHRVIGTNDIECRRYGYAPKIKHYQSKRQRPNN